MKFRKRPSTEETWGLLRAELRRLRGQNLLRAREEQFPSRNEVILYDELRGDRLIGCWIIDVTENPETLTAKHLPSGETLKVDSDLSTFMETIASRLRGKDYLRTKDKGTTYR